jgi:hypothetical protein
MVCLSSWKVCVDQTGLWSQNVLRGSYLGKVPNCPKLSNMPWYRNPDVVYTIVTCMPTLIDFPASRCMVGSEQAEDLCLVMRISPVFDRAVRVLFKKLHSSLQRWAQQLARERLPSHHDNHMRSISLDTQVGRIKCGYLWVLREIIRFQRDIVTFKHEIVDADLLRACVMAGFWGPLDTEVFPSRSLPEHIAQFRASPLPSVRLVHYLRQIRAAWTGIDNGRELRCIADAVHYRRFGDQPVHILRLDEVCWFTREVHDELHVKAPEALFPAEPCGIDYTVPIAERDSSPCECRWCDPNGGDRFVYRNFEGPYEPDVEISILDDHFSN